MHDPDYVDAYFGPAEWRAEAEASSLTLEQVLAQADSLVAFLKEAEPNEGDEARLRALTANAVAMHTRVRLLSGEKIPFDEQTKLLFGVVAPPLDAKAEAERRAALDATYPGTGTLAQRQAAYLDATTVPNDTIRELTDITVEECRRRSNEWIDLPEGEGFELELVQDKPWGGFNYYLGNYQSKIEINTDRRIGIGRFVDIGCHEGYPGHHVYGVLRDKIFVQERGWVEHTLYPLFAPSAILAEGSAEYGIAMAFPGNSKIAYERDTLYSIADLDPAVVQVAGRLAMLPSIEPLIIDVARQYSDGEISAEAAITRLINEGPMPEREAADVIGFVDYNGSYIVNYSLGYDLIDRYLDAVSSTPAQRWEKFEELLVTPLVPEDLENAIAKAG
ncbi:hypothetical protein [Altererythrobacter lutimaris]|uniref:DUF885 domain-containing protein n=1 Tax=Altererythrobacter lutimaris TaxID=2743979 RepID=A0A850HA93_9SPHN|nr:hypothetical protein [Altererythrobacter lutimaris]NVE94883.1 hypothetical protein [Altererythrobacter lutimaris]